MISFSSLFSEIVRTKNKEYLDKLEIFSVGESEQSAIKQVKEYISTYGDFPLLSYISGEMHLNHLVDTSLNGAPVPSIFESFVKKTRINLVKRILEEEISRAAAYKEDVEPARILTKLKALPSLDINAGGSLLAEFDDDIFNPDLNEGIPTGLEMIDNLGGFKKGNLITIVATPKTGKTTLMTQLAAKFYSEGYKVLFVTLEMSKQEIDEKTYSIIGEFDDMLLLNRSPLLKELKPRVFNRIQYIDTIIGGVLTIKHGIGMTPEKLVFLQKEEFKNTGRPYDIVIVDGFYLMPSSVEGIWQSVQHNVQVLKQFAMGNEEEGLPPSVVLCTSQLVAGSDGMSPEDVKKSKAIIEISNSLISLVKLDETNRLRLQFLAQRRGPGHGYTDFNFDWSNGHIYIYDPVTKKGKRMWAINQAPLESLLKGLEINPTIYKPVQPANKPIEIEEYEEPVHTTEFNPEELWR